MKQKAKIIYLSHGGGPMPLLGDSDHQEMVSTLKMLAKRVGKPSAILVVSAHWEARLPTVTCGQTPRLIYDYGGFPKEAYNIQYPCLGEPELANRVYDAILEQGLDARRDDQRGFDHGVFVPLSIMYPEADIPCVQLSLVQSLDANLHIKMGKALCNLTWDNLLVIGSGFSFHNMRAFSSSSMSKENVKNQAFQQWLKATVSDNTISESIREQQLVNWEKAPHARFCHPREEHLLPLHVCYGMASNPCDEFYSIEIMKKQSSMFFWNGCVSSNNVEA